MKNRSFPVRLRFALAGVLECWRRERSFRTHTAFGIAALAALVVIRPAPVWWALVGLVITLVLVLELVNSAIERLIDHLHPDIHPEIKIVKDMAAGAVLLMSGGALVVALGLAFDIW